MTSLNAPMRQEVLIDGKYRLGPIIGTGGIATVRRATHVWTEREVAVKLLDPTLPHFEQLRAGFSREARATVQLNHPNVVDVLDMGEDGWETAYLVMELLHGPTLRDVLLERGKLGEEDTLAILLPLLDALEKAHQLGIIHRDFKPENIMLPLDAYGVVTPKLLDFGVAEILEDACLRGLTPGGVIMGTPEYMSPEQARDQRELVGPHTDVWGVAVLWYECLTGRVPFDGDSPEGVLHAVCEAPVDFDEVPNKYVPLLRDALQRSTDLRIRSIAELKARIERLGFARATIPPAPASLSSIPAPPDEQNDGQYTLAGLGPGKRLVLAPAAEEVDSEVVRLPNRSNRNLWLSGVMVAFAVGFAAWWTLREPHDEPQASPEAVIARPDPSTMTASGAQDAVPEPAPVKAEVVLTKPVAAETTPGVTETMRDAAGVDETKVEETPPQSVAEEEAAAAQAASASPESVQKKTARVKPSHAKARAPAPEAPEPDDSLYQKPPDLVTEW